MYSFSSIIRKNSRIFLFGLLLISTSCNSQISKESKLVLDETKKEILSCLDSTNYYFDLVITDYEKKVSNTEIEKKYNRKIELFETKIDQAFEKINKLAKEGKLTPAQYEKWLNEIKLKPFTDKNERIQSLGINLDKLPITNVYELTQQYLDSINHFSMRFPNNWTIIDNYQNFTLISGGPIEIVGQTSMKKEGKLALDITKQSKDYSTEEYYEGNLTSIKNKYPDLRLIEEKSINLNGIKAKYIIYECTIQGRGKFTSLQIYFMKNKNGYILNGAEKTEDFEIFRDLYIEIARTFKLTK